jgi:transposase-like protein
LRQADGDGTIESICREHNISKATFHRWRCKYGDMELADAKRLSLRGQVVVREPSMARRLAIV